jgi:hypothetical protein
VLSNGELVAARLDTLVWQRILPDVVDVRSAALF